MAKELYLEEIDHPSLTEEIDEKYDSVTTLMPPNAVIYGSALTSRISGLPANGDLDISISPSEYSQLAQSLQASTKWLQIEGDTVSTGGGLTLEWSSNGGLVKPTMSKNPYEEVEEFPLEETVAFEDVNGAKVQVIKASQNSTDPLDDALSVVRKVDFTFCGMAMDKYGRIIEAIPNAYSDCCAGLIRMANYRQGDDKRVRERLEKYLKRGWQLTMSIDAVMENFKRLGKAETDETEPARPLSLSFGVDRAKGHICTVGFSRTAKDYFKDIGTVLSELSVAFGGGYNVEVDYNRYGEYLIKPTSKKTWSQLDRDCDFLNNALYKRLKLQQQGGSWT